MRLNRKVSIALAAVPLIGLSAALPAAAASGTTAGRAQAAAIPRAVGPTTKVVVMLRQDATHYAPRTAAGAHLVANAEAPLAASLRSAGARNVTTGRAIPYIVASVTKAQQRALASNPAVKLVMPDVRIPDPIATPVSSQPVATSSHPTSAVDTAPSICGTASDPELDPEALSVINAPQAINSGIDGAGVTVAYIAGSIDTTIPDFQRNSAFASSGSPAGSPVVSEVNMSGDPSDAPGGEVATESFLDASSIAAQANSVYDLNNFINSSHTEPSSPCDIKIEGAAPGANVMGIDVFSNDYGTTESNFIEGIDYAVANGVLVINESFGSNNFPDTALDATKIADDDAVAAGVTVVVSSGDAGVTSTLGSPATDPKLISVGASTTFRSYEQNFYGGINATTPTANNGTWIDNNISSLSSGGFAMSGANTVDLVAPGDLNWILCSTSSQFSSCTDENGNPSPIAQSGGTSESSPLTAAAAADVIQAYSSTHNGDLPTPAMVKQILVSSATDISAPAEQQGAGLLNVEGAVQLAESVNGPTGTPPGGLLISPNQVNIVQAPGASATKTISITNTGTKKEKVSLSTRALTKQVGKQTGSFCLNPSDSSSGACGPPTANTFAIWSGVTEVYQEETFTVPSTTGTSRLNFSADYPDTDQSSLLHVALLDPTGAYAGYSLPQGLADYANIQVANPVAGTWTAIFFTEQSTDSATGTSGTIHWGATTSEFESAGTISPSSLSIGAGDTGTATLTVKSPSTSGDTAQSVVVSSGSLHTTVPVTVRTTVPLGKSGGTFSGVLTGGNGRGNPAQTSTYQFTVPKGLHDLDVSAQFADTNDGVVAFLVDPQGETVASSSSVTFNKKGNGVITTGAVNLYKDSPAAGTYLVVLDWLEPVSGSELSEPFTGAVQFNEVSITSNLPSGKSADVDLGKTYTYTVHIKNTGVSPEDFFVDPRLSGTDTYRLADFNGSDQGMTLPLASGWEPIYFVPNDTSEVLTSLEGTLPVTYDTEPLLGDPDLSPGTPAPGVTGSQGYYGATLNYTPPSGEVYPGIWYLNPSEIGPYGAGGAPSATASASFSVKTLEFDTNMTSSTSDLWLESIGDDADFTPTYVQPGKSATITIQLKPSGKVGSTVSGVVNVDDTFQADVLIGVADSSADELAALPFNYTVCSSKGRC